MEAMCLWKELIQLNVPEEGCSTTLRMEDFTRKVREVVEVEGKERRVGFLNWVDHV